MLMLVLHVSAALQLGRRPDEVQFGLSASSTSTWTWRKVPVECGSEITCCDDEEEECFAVAVGAIFTHLKTSKRAILLSNWQCHRDKTLELELQSLAHELELGHWVPSHHTSSLLAMMDASTLSMSKVVCSSWSSNKTLLPSTRKLMLD